MSRGLLSASATAAVLVAATGTATLAHTAPHPGNDSDGPGLHSRRGGAGKDLAALRKSLAKYRDVSVATRDGFIPVSACADSPQGAMGVHYLNPALATAPVDAAHPAVLLYAPEGDDLRLVGAEWFQADADQDLATDEDRPFLWGRGFDGPMAGHDPMMPAHYDLHVWLYDSNPDGVFAPWNPSLSC